MQHRGIAKRVYIFDDYITSLRNGIGVYVRELSHCLSTIGCTVTLIVLNSKYEDFTMRENRGVYYLYIPVFPDRSSIIPEKNKIVCRFLRLYIEDNTDNVFFFNHSPANALMKEIKQYFPSSKLIYTIHDLSWCSSLLGNAFLMEQIIGQKRKNREVLENWKMQLQTMDMADAVVCLSEDALHSLGKTSPFPSSRIHLIPNALRIDKRKFPTATKQELRKRVGISPNEIILLFVGRMTKAKGVVALLKALSALRDYYNIRLAIAGSLATIDLNSFTEVMPSVIYLGHIKKEKLYQWYKIADIGMVTSYTEQCSYVGLEMMSHRLPVIASDGFGVRCMFRNEINAVTACIGDRTSDNEYVRNIVNAVKELADDDELKMQLALKAQKILEQRYSIKIMKANYKRLLLSF